MLRCGICGHQVDPEEIERRDSGDFHRVCLSSLRTAGVGVNNSAADQVECRLCNQDVQKGAPIVEFFGIACVAHLRCFFGTWNRGIRSLGAGAPRRSLADRGKALRAHSDAIRALSRRLIAANHLWAV
jgi:hypothetical protein